LGFQASSWVAVVTPLKGSFLCANWRCWPVFLSFYGLSVESAFFVHINSFSVFVSYYVLLIVCLCTLVTYTPTLLYFVIIANRCTIDWKWFFFANPLISTYLPSYMFAFALIVVFLRGKHLVGKHVTAKHATGKHLTGSVDCWQALKLVSMWALRRFLASFPITCFLVAYFMITCFLSSVFRRLFLLLV